MRRGADDPYALTAVKEAVLRIDPRGSLMPSAPAEDAPAEPGWVLWGRLRTAPSPVYLPADSGILATAVHSAQGMTLCLVNRSTEKKSLRLQFRLPRGVYKGERLTFTPPDVVATMSPASRSTVTESRLRTISDSAQEAKASPASPIIELERIQGRTLNAPTVVKKPFVLLPGQVCFYRFTDVAQAARAAVNETYDSLHTMALKSPGPAARLRHILEEGNGSRASLSAGNRSGSARLSGIHRLLLLTAQVQSMQRNYQQRHTVNAAEGAAVMGALERLTDALAETSAVLLEMLPQITVREESAPDAGPVPPEGSPARTVLVTVSLANLGRQSPGMVKLGLDTAALPRGVACVPDDPAYFGAVHPGQSVRAIFRLRCPAGTLLPTDRCGGDVSYFVSGAPAHLRIRAW
jgi:hypothetical protein